MASFASTSAIPLPGAVEENNGASGTDNGVKIVAGPSRFTPEKLKLQERCEMYASTSATFSPGATLQSARTPVKKFTDGATFDSVESWGKGQRAGLEEGVKAGTPGSEGAAASLSVGIVSPGQGQKRAAVTNDHECKDGQDVVQKVRGRMSANDAVQKKKASYLMDTTSIVQDSRDQYRVSLVLGTPPELG